MPRNLRRWEFRHPLAIHRAKDRWGGLHKTRSWPPLIPRRLQSKAPMILQKSARRFGSPAQRAGANGDDLACGNNFGGRFGLKNSRRVQRRIGLPLHQFQFIPVSLAVTDKIKRCGREHRWCRLEDLTMRCGYRADIMGGGVFVWIWVCARYVFVLAEISVNFV